MSRKKNEVLGEKHPMSINVESPLAARNGIYAAEVKKKYDLTPAGIIQQLDLLNVDYEKLAEGCHYRMELPKAEL